MDELQLVSNLPSSDIFPIILDLEMQEIIRVLPGNYYELLNQE